LLYTDNMKQFEALINGNIERYLSYRPKEGDRPEKLIDHIMLTVRYASMLNDHIATLVRIIRRVDSRLKPEVVKTFAKYLALFTAFYHDIGKAEIHYQLYAHRVLDRVKAPHNYASVAFVIENDDIFRGFVEMLTKNYDVDTKVVEVMFKSSLIAVALHHEYYDYRDLSFVEVLTPLTIALAKDIDMQTELIFHDTTFDLLQKLATDVNNNFNVQIPVPQIRRSFSIRLGQVVEYITTLHYEFGDMDETIASTLELAEALTWILVLADNLAARHRGSAGKKLFFAPLISRYYG